MLTEDLLTYIMEDQLKTPGPTLLIHRMLPKETPSGRIRIISGIRRCGKSTYLREQFRDSGQALFLNFEDPRLEGFDLQDFYKLESIAEKKGMRFFVFDEIQNVPEWEQYVRSAYDRKKKFFLTGSNASMLSRELGTKLTGRYRQTELFPFSYSEYLQFRKLQKGKESLERYLLEGGFPEYLEENDPEYLRTLLRDIVSRDIAVRRNLRNESDLIRLAVFLLSNCGKEFSYNRITGSLQIRSVRTTIDYCDFLRESYLVDYIPRFSWSVRQQQNNPKKVYGVDTGLIKANSLSLSPDSGRFLENVVFSQLRRQGLKIEYFRDERCECDFVVRNPEGASAIQVCSHIDRQNMQRELLGLKNAMVAIQAKQGCIITLDQEDTLDGIPVIPAWKWLSDPNLS